MVYCKSKYCQGRGKDMYSGYCGPICQGFGAKQTEINDLKSENARLKERYEEAMTAVGEVVSSIPNSEPEVERFGYDGCGNCDDIATLEGKWCEWELTKLLRALIAKHDKEKEGKGN